MAGPSIGTWVKVRNKSGRLTARVIPNKFGGGSYQQGEVITQSEFQKVQEKRAKANKGDGGNQSLSNKKGQGLLFDTRSYISKDAVSKERDAARWKIDDLREAKKSIQEEIEYRMEKRVRTKSSQEKDDLIVARYQSKVVRINQQIKKMKDVKDGKVIPARVRKGTVDEMPSKPNRDRDTVNARLLRVKKTRERKDSKTRK